MCVCVCVSEGEEGERRSVWERGWGFCKRMHHRVRCKEKVEESRGEEVGERRGDGRKRGGGGGEYSIFEPCAMKKPRVIEHMRGERGGGWMGTIVDLRGFVVRVSSTNTAAVVVVVVVAINRKKGKEKTRKRNAAAGGGGGAGVRALGGKKGGRPRLLHRPPRSQEADPATRLREDFWTTLACNTCTRRGPTLEREEGSIGCGLWLMGWKEIE